MQTASTSASKAIWPIAAICCVVLVVFVIAAAIVLALIPVYLPRKDVTPAENLDNSNAPFYLEYEASGFDDDDSAVAGNLDDTLSLKSAMNFPDDTNIGSGQTAPSSVDRRKRSFYSLRSKRAITVRIILVVNFVATRCNIRCLTARKTFRTGLPSKSFSNIQITINGGPLVGIKNSKCSMKYIGLFRTRPSGFTGPASSLDFTTIKSGEFTDASIWSEGILPYGNCTITIAAGTIVTLSRSGLGIRARVINIYGTLILGGGNAVFTFKNAVNCKVRKGGKLQDATTTKVIRIPVNSVIYLYSGGGFGEGKTTIKYPFKDGEETFEITNPIGPFTWAILPSGTLRQVAKITFFVVASGLFKSGATYCGGSAPTADDCTDSPCALEVLTNFTLSTADLNGVLDINIDSLTIFSGATLELGTPGSTAGFKFKFPIQLVCSGILSFVASGGGILLPIGSAFRILAGGSFKSIVATFLQVYDPLTGILGVIQVLKLSMTEPFGFSFVSISVITVIIIDGVTVTGAVSTTTTPTATIIPG